MYQDTTKAVYNALYRQSFDLPTVRDILKRNIFISSTLTNKKIDEIACEILSYKEKNFLFTGNTEKSGQISDAISAYVKGTRYNGKAWEPIFSMFNKFCEDKEYTFSDSQWKALYGLIHQVIMSSLSEIQMFSYIEQTFPLWSGLKRLLFQKRRGTDLKQWEYALQECNITERRAVNIGINLVSLQKTLDTVQNYKSLADYYAKLLITAICQKTFPDWRIDITIDSWFSDNNILNVPKQHNIEKDVLYKLAYSFNMSLEEFDSLAIRCEKAVYDAFSVSDNLYRFGIKYSVKYSEITTVITQAHNDTERFQSPPAEYNQAEMKRKINNFFDKYSYSDGMIEKYLDFLSVNGVCHNNAELLIVLRADNAQRYVWELYKKFNLESIRYYYKDFDSLNSNVSDIPDIADLLKEKYGEDDAGDYYHYFTEYIYRITHGQYRGDIKSKILMLLCDGIDVDKKDIASGAFSNSRLNHIKEHSDNLFSYPIRRSEILRLAYLDTLLDYFNYNTNDNDIITRFEKTANRMLMECEFLPLHITLKLDFIMYLALSERKLCKTNIFQLFIPRKEM